MRRGPDAPVPPSASRSGSFAQNGCRWRAPAGRITGGLWVSTALLVLAGVILTAMSWSDLAQQDAFSNLGSTIAAVFYATLGALIVRRVHNLIGWMLLGEGAGLAILSLASAYAVVGIATHPGTLPAPQLVGLLAEWIFVPVVVGACLHLLPLPIREIAVVALASRRDTRPHSDRASIGRVSRPATARGASHTRRYLTDVPEPARRQVARPCPANSS